MMNKIQKMIIDLEAKTDRDEMDEKRLEILRCKQEELGEDPTEAEITRAVADVLKAFILMIVQKKRDESAAAAEAVCVDEVDDVDAGDAENKESLDNDVDWLEDDEDDEDDGRAFHLNLDSVLDLSGDTTKEIEQIRSIFREMDLHICDFEIKEGVHAFEGTLYSDRKWLLFRIYVESDPKMVRMDVKYPFFAKKALAPFLCEKLIEETYPRRFGALLYDASDGKLVYQYNLPMSLGLHSDEFLAIFLSLTKSAFDSYDTVFRYAIGDFTKPEKWLLATHAQDLINMLE